MKKIYLILLALLGLHLFVLTKLQFTAWPEMLSFPYMIDNGFLIYKDFHHVYEPLLTYMLLGFYKIFGFSILSLKLFTYIYIVLIDLFIFSISKKIIGKKIISLLPLSIFVIYQSFFEGNMLWFDLGVTLPILVSIYFILSWEKKRMVKHIFLSGIFLTTAFLIKQQAILIILPFLLFSFLQKVKRNEIMAFVVGGLIPIISLIIFLFSKNLFPDYIFWTFSFPLVFLPKIEGYSQLPSFKQMFLLLGISTPILIGWISNFKKINSVFYLLFGVFLFEIIYAFPRFSFFHLQPAIATLVLLYGYLLLGKNRFYMFSLFLVSISIFTMLFNMLTRPLMEKVRFYDEDKINLSMYIKSNTKETDRIYLLGPDSLTYVLSSRLPPKPWIENYVWHFEIPEMQEKVINGWKIDPPMFIYWTQPTTGNYYELGTYQPKKITDYIISNYDRIKEVQSGVWEWKLKIK